MGKLLRYYITADKPDIELWLLDDDGDLIDFSTGYTFSFKIGTQVGTTALLTKTSGITGAVGAGSEPDGTPNVVVAFTAGELGTAVTTAGNYVWQLTCTKASADRVFTGLWEALAVVA